MVDSVENFAPIDPAELWRRLGHKPTPTDQQAGVIGAPPGPLLVVAGAGAGKTETMANRVLWLVANGFVRPEEVLGLTFTRKAAAELNRRIRRSVERLSTREDVMRDVDPSGTLAKSLAVVAPSVYTYDAYAGHLVREYGLLVPVEPDSRLITQAELYAIARDVVSNYQGTLVDDGGQTPAVSTVVANVLALYNKMGNELTNEDSLALHAEAFTSAVNEFPKPNATLRKWRDNQNLRMRMLPLVHALRDELKARGLSTFNEQMSAAATIARDHPEVGKAQRARYRVVMLDEYQDTSHAQRILLRSLFGRGRDAGSQFPHPLTVTAVGDPMQAIYGWRGATSANLGAFTHDFPTPDDKPADKLQLTISWRNPPEVLTLANHVSDTLLGPAGDSSRPVEPLQANPFGGAGTAELGYFATAEEELNFVADALAKEYQRCTEEQTPFDAAVLVRKNRHSAGIARALEERGVPYEVVGVGGLLTVPEIKDVVALMTMLVRPDDSAAALRILGGPLCGLGLKDLVALAQRATNLTGAGTKTNHRDDEAELSTDPLERLGQQIERLKLEAVAEPGEVQSQAGLGDALADLGEEDRYSAEGLRRLRQLASMLHQLRRNSLGKPLPDLIDDVVSASGLRIEVLARNSPTGTVHLDRFADVALAYPGSDVEGFLDYLALAAEHEDGLAPGAVPAKDNRVQIMTAHKSKGMEWEIVSVLHADESTYKSEKETFLNRVTHFPTRDFRVEEVLAATENKKEFEAYCSDYMERQKEIQDEESTRLFYVAITRAARRLLVTASEKPPYGQFEALHAIAESNEDLPGIQVLHWWDGVEAEDESEPDPLVGLWPDHSPEPNQRHAADLVRSAGDALFPVADDSEDQVVDQWAVDSAAIIEEFKDAQNPVLEVELPQELTASDVVALRADATEFARRARRPVPFKPNAYAKRGTAFHEWIEGFYGARPLLDEDELPGIDEADFDAATLARLKDAFASSHWASKTPVKVEHPFEIALGSAVVRGRIDAVFETDDGWIVVDWKTGTKPAPRQMESAKLQLAVYREAWKRYVRDDRPIQAMFFYVRDGEDFAPRDLPERDELERLLQTSVQAGLLSSDG
ncbi:ATP-dependent helicase [Corynebacterium aquatimens]|uniref:DNA 3'-5' helicase n=1 Tax=Corynebacterium aquatimens TaxID=1190508 RepID=A0A931GY33_9CORY|nr:UvrD-helicase domain-containing protein [Corynebacterium aquatimens]MBG6123179.1 DNA helicase-2/ATP-dependent DNA helicase PcrA [Corynebacterium aquatimens]WJY66490.1 ATP-dependent DNA helicase PcrA [Corynebacterium aquatimens]